MSSIEFSIKYNRRNKLNKNGEAEVVVRAYQNARKGGRPREKFFSTGVYLQPKDWDEKRKRVKGLRALEYNEIIRQTIDNLTGFVAKEEVNGKKPTIEQVEDYIVNGKMGDFFDFAKREIENANIKPSTKKSKRARLHNIMGFREKLKFEDIDYNYRTDIERYFYKKGYGTNYIDKMITDLIQYSREAVRRGYMDANNNPFRDYKHKHVSTEKDYLNREDIELLETVKLPTNLQYYRDLYLFMCYTGLSYYDCIYLKQSDIEETGERIFIRRKRQKSGTNIDIPISILSSGKAVDLINKYKTDDRAEIFRFVYSQTINKYMANICDIAGIQKHLTTSTARITRACTLARLGARDSTIQNTLGHSKPSTTIQYYVKRTRETLADELEELERKQNNIL